MTIDRPLQPGEVRPGPAVASPRDFLRSLFDAAVASARPAVCLPPHLPSAAELAALQARGGRLLVIGAGKASAAMAEALETHWQPWAETHGLRWEGLVVTRYGHARPCRHIEIVEAAHPVPDAAGQAAAERMLALVDGLSATDQVICLISGGGSALLSLPAAGVTLADKQALSRALLSSGAAIDEINCVRKHLSAIKGGRLAARCAPARLLTLAISDVPGDDPAVIASGPTVPDATTCADALRILDRHGIELPPALRAGLESGAFETPKPGDARLVGQHYRLIATPLQALRAAAARAQAAGIEAHVLGDAIEGESLEVGKVHAAIAHSVARHGEPFRPPCVLLSGGETTVTLRGPAERLGRGGRAGEFLLGCALGLQGRPGIWALAADTDGIDGVEDNAGALVTPDTLARAAAAGHPVADAAARHDAWGCFHTLGDLVVTGPTHTNVNDFRALLVLPE